MTEQKRGVSTAEQVVGWGTFGVALLGMVVAWGDPIAPVHQSISIATGLLAVLFVAAAVLGQRFHIHIRSRTKVVMQSTVLYLIAVMLPPVLAVPAVGISVFASGMLARSQRGTRLCHMVCDSGRFMLIALAVSTVAEAPVPHSLQSLPLLLAAALMFAADLLTAPLLFTPALRERPLKVIHSLFMSGWKVEGAQYLIGLLGALIALQEIWALALLAIPTAMVYQAFKQSFEMQTTTREMLFNLADTVDLRDPYTGGHSRRVADITRDILRALGRKHGPEVEMIVMAARVHDIGKVGIPDEILNKQSKFTSEERVIMETHAEEGAKLIGKYPDFSQGVNIVRHHHESWDGTGYPHRLQGQEIPFGARVICVADCYDAMTTDRPYQRGRTVTDVVAVLREGRGRQWDAEIVDAFLQVLTEKHGEDGMRPRLRVVKDNEEASSTVSA